MKYMLSISAAFTAAMFALATPSVALTAKEARPAPLVLTCQSDAQMACIAFEEYVRADPQLVAIGYADARWPRATKLTLVMTTVQNGALEGHLEWGRPTVPVHKGPPVRVSGAPDSADVLVYFIATLFSASGFPGGR